MRSGLGAPVAGAIGLALGVAAIVAVEREATFQSMPLLVPALVVAIPLCIVALSRLAAARGRAVAVAVPLLFAVLVLGIWEVMVRALGVSPILLPPPSRIGASIAVMLPDLLLDFEQTVVESAIPGFLLGSCLGFAVALAVDRSRFLKDGLQPLSNFAGVIPIIGVAPIMIMWFGFGSASKIAVVVLMTFFPSFSNTIAGLKEARGHERDLMVSYAASYWQTLWKLRLPMALPFVFAALKVNASLALIGTIVAEFFGTPFHGLGFRISVEIGHLSVDHVWAAITAAGLSGAMAYGLLTMIERAANFWHPTQRGGAS